VSTAEDYGNGTFMVLGEGEKPSGEEVSFSLQSTTLLKGTKDRPTGVQTLLTYFKDRALK
jgi:hypothetical protein